MERMSWISTALPSETRSKGSTIPGGRLAPVGQLNFDAGHISSLPSSTAHVRRRTPSLTQSTSTECSAIYVNALQEHLKKSGRTSLFAALENRADASRRREFSA